MINQLYDAICRGIDVRQNLNELRSECKDEKKREKVCTFLKEDDSVLHTLLANPDAKVRKNTVLLIGDLHYSAMTAPLFDAYEKEETRFVKSTYLSVLSKFNYEPYMERLQKRLEALEETPKTPENTKHLREEQHILIRMVRSVDMQKHTFSGFHSPVDCILMTNPLYKDVTKNQIANGKFLPYGAGVRVVTPSFNELLPIRTYKEILFVRPDMMICPMNPDDAAKIIAQSDLLTWLKSCHTPKTDAPFFFRVELKSKLPLSERSEFCKEFSMALEEYSQGNLINSTSDYEIEIRFITTKSGTLNTLIKLYTIPDERFSYRKNAVAASIHPVDAALLVELAKEYMVKDAQVLDPFCGVGTMLIERQKAVKANTSYGIDIFKTAIEGAKENTEAAGQIIHYIGKDFFQFTHTYLFDEIFTNMPFTLKKEDEETIVSIYEQFFAKIKQHLTNQGTLILYSHNLPLVRKFAEKYQYRIVTDFAVKPKENTHLVILKVR